ncbi:MAG TPA: hypothetical protein VFC98_02530 [Clostridia bacterium]|nr:hypothetical protein [Clostridia bacterium]
MIASDAIIKSLEKEGVDIRGYKPTSVGHGGQIKRAMKRMYLWSCI